MSAAIEISGLAKSYRRGLFSHPFQALAGVDLRIESGETWALAGANGAGKTTTLHLLMGLLRPDAGRIRVFGVDPRKAEARRSVGHQSEIFFSYPYRTAEDALRFYGRLCGMRDPALGSRVDEVLRLFELQDVRAQKLRTFSKGMMQRLGLAQSILHDPSLIVWDEPSTGLDPEGRRLVADIVLKLKGAGKTVVLSTHILSDIERACDRIAIMKKGRLIAAQTIATLVGAHPGQTLEDVYLSIVRETDA